VFKILHQEGATLSEMEEVVNKVGGWAVGYLIGRLVMVNPGQFFSILCKMHSKFQSNYQKEMNKRNHHTSQYEKVTQSCPKRTIIDWK